MWGPAVGPLGLVVQRLGECGSPRRAHPSTATGHKSQPHSDQCQCGADQRPTRHPMRGPATNATHQACNTSGTIAYFPLFFTSAPGVILYKSVIIVPAAGHSRNTRLGGRCALPNTWATPVLVVPQKATLALSCALPTQARAHLVCGRQNRRDQGHAPRRHMRRHAQTTCLESRHGGVGIDLQKTLLACASCAQSW